MLYEYLIKNYQFNEPIFMVDIDLPVSSNNLRQMFKNLCDAGKIMRYDNGIYYIPKQSKLKGAVPFTPEKIALYKYVLCRGGIEGYYSGYTFANQMGITTQVPVTIEIVSNNASAMRREVNLSGQRIVLRKPRTKVTESNARVLQLLDLLKDIHEYADGESDDVTEKIVQYIKTENITREQFDEYISLYPDRIYKNLYEMRLYNAFA